MKKSRYSEAKIISLLGRDERGEKVRDLCCELGISEACTTVRLYRWKAKYGGMTLSDAKRLKT
jgi:putative transposase